MNVFRGVAWALVFEAVIAGIFCVAVKAETLVGYDVLGLAKQDVRMLIRHTDDNRAIGVLEGTFGDVIPPLEQYLRSGKVTAFRAHLTNGTCARFNKCEAGEPGAKSYKAIAKRAAAFEALAKRHPLIKCYLSPRLEHDEKDTAVIKEWIRILNTQAPSCIPVISAFSGHFSPDALKEKHGSKASAQIISTDGDSFYDVNSFRYHHQGTVLAFAWINSFNLRFTGEKVWVPPSKRTRKTTIPEIKQLRRMLRKAEPEPSACAPVVPPEVWKTNAEDFNNGDVRSNKAVFIIQKKHDRIPLTNLGGKQIACLKYYGPFENGMHRHYIGTCSGHDPVDLMDAAGGEWLYGKAGNKCYRLNAIRRLGVYR